MKHKTFGQVFTPRWIVEEILNMVDFKGNNLVNKKIIDPACGDGAFLYVISERIIDFGLKNGFNNKKIKDILEKTVFGIEKDKIIFNQCLSNLNNLVKNKLKENIIINWNIFNNDTLMKYKDFLGYFDFVVGNPPYIRIHNLENKTRKLLKENFIFTKGNIDIYISFFEIGFKLLNKKGILGYITPNSYLHNSSYLEFRKFLIDNRAVKELTDFKNNKVFNGFSTYTAITIINFFENKDYLIYKELKDGKIQEVNKIKYTDIKPDNWSFSNEKNMLFLKQMYLSKSKKIKDLFNIQYGIATLRDRIFIGKIEQNNKISTEKGNLILFNNYLLEKEILKKIIKGSTYKGKKEEIKYILFPYKKQGDVLIPFSEEEIKNKFPYAYKYLLQNKNELLKRDIEKGNLWYEFGRRQGLKNAFQEKIVVAPIIKDKITFHRLDKNILVYSGIFITKKEQNVKWEVIENILNSEKFLKYIKIIGKNLANGYISLSTKNIKDYPIDF